MRKPRVGLFLISPERFQKIGEGTARDSYLVRKQKEAAWMAETASEQFDVTFYLHRVDGKFLIYDMVNN